MNIADKLNDFLSKTIRDHDEDGYKVTLDRENNGLVDISYYTWWINDYCEEFGAYPLFYRIRQADMAPIIRKVSLTGEDEGINGMHYWDLETFLKGKPVFENMEEFQLHLNETGIHNLKVVTYDDMHYENGALGLLLDACPNLKMLTAPSAPGANFFERDLHPLQELNLQAGFSHQNFIKNLAVCTCFPSFIKLTFRDYAETYMDDYKSNCVPYEQYEALLNAKNLPTLKEVNLIDTVLTQEQKDSLSALANSRNIALAFSAL